jgi:hypothetical protein
MVLRCLFHDSGEFGSRCGALAQAPLTAFPQSRCGRIGRQAAENELSRPFDAGVILISFGEGFSAEGGPWLFAPERAFLWPLLD